MNTEQPGPGQTDARNAWQTRVSDLHDPKNLGVEFVVEDNQFSGNAAIAAYRSLRDSHHVKSIISFGGPAVLAVRPIVEGEKFPMLALSAAVQLDKGGNGSITRIWESPRVTQPYTEAQWGEVLALGEAVTVIGYPNITPATINVQETIQKGDVRTITEPVPQPTIAEGIIANVGAKITPDAEKGTRLSELGDMFQLSTQAIGPGSSGGPVFDSRGQVIGLMTMMGNRAAFAVPIRYGNDLLKVSS